MATVKFPAYPTNRLKPYSLLLACLTAMETDLVHSVEYPDATYSVDLGVLGPVGNPTPNQISAGNAISTACSRGGNDPSFQTRCNALARLDNTQGATILPTILGQVTSEQTAAQNTQSLEMNNNHMSTLSNRISAIRNGRLSGGLQLSGLMLDPNGNATSVTQLAKLNRTANKAAAGDSGFDRLGIFVNGNIGFGDRRTTLNEAGYNQDTHGMTTGVDYRFTEHFLLGTAFSYNNARTGYTGNLGNMETDSFSGALYGSFFTDNGFFVDGIFSGSHADYASNRNIQYSIPTDPTFSGNTVATGKNQGDEFNFAMTSGFNFNKGGLTITPQVRVDYTSSSVDALNEQGGEGWALHIDQQAFESLQTAAGLQLAYAISLPWAVIIPTARAEYIHEFQNDSRNIRAFYLGDGNVNKAFFNIATDNPDRDFIVAGAGLSAQFAHGISAFVNYDTVQAHSYVNNHNFSGGIRLELAF